MKSKKLLRTAAFLVAIIMLVGVFFSAVISSKIKIRAFAPPPTVVGKAIAEQYSLLTKSLNNDNSKTSAIMSQVEVAQISTASKQNYIMNIDRL